MMDRVSKLAQVAKQNPELKGRAHEVLVAGKETSMFDNPESIANMKK